MKNQNFTNRSEYIDYFTRKADNIIDKQQYILNHCINKSVLDLGCIDHSAKTAIELGDKWLHRQIKSISKKVVGIDILEEDAIELNNLGYNIICDDVETFNLNEIFDIIVAGDIIEHLSNVGQFIHSVKKHMNQDSLFIITTPNPFNIEQTMLALFHNNISVHDQHTSWLSPHNFWEIAQRHGLVIQSFQWIDTRFHFEVSRKYFIRITKWIVKIVSRKRKICNRDFAVVLKINRKI